MRNMDIKTYKVRQNIIRLIFPFKSLNKKVNPYKACIYGLCRDFLDGVGYDLGTKLFLAIYLLLSYCKEI